MCNEGPETTGHFMIWCSALEEVRQFILKSILQCGISVQFKKIINFCYIKDEYNVDAMRQSACLVLNPITVYSCGFLFNCTAIGQASQTLQWL